MGWDWDWDGARGRPRRKEPRMLLDLCGGESPARGDGASICEGFWVWVWVMEGLEFGAGEGVTGRGQ